MEIKHPLSVIDGRKVKLKDAFSWVLNYYNPHKKIPEIMPKVIDCTCGKMLMWHEKDFKRFNVITNDLNKQVTANYHYNVVNLHHFLEPNTFDIAAYDPPYINLKNRKDSIKYEKAFKYSMIKDIDHLETVTTESSLAISELLKKYGILIAKITDFHYQNKLRGHYDFIKWFSKDFYLWDIIIYRFYKPIPNLNFYSKKCAKTHSYFLIFKKK